MHRNVGVLAVSTLLATALAAPAAEPPEATGDAAACLYVPPWLEDRVVYYLPFEGDLKTPRVNRVDLETVLSRGSPAPGLTGTGLQDPKPANSAGPVSLRGSALTPSRPLTLSLWWRLDAPMTAETCFHLLTLQGGGMVSNFVRGQRAWCGLKASPYVLQVYNYEGIANINGLWHGNAWVEPQVWHHVAMVFSHAAAVDVYWDGTLRSHYAVRGRPFAAADGGSLEIGPNWLFHPMTLDDLMVLDRALSADEVAAYVLAVRSLSQVEFPVLGPE